MNLYPYLYVEVSGDGDALLTIEPSTGELVASRMVDRGALDLYVAGQREEMESWMEEGAWSSSYPPYLVGADEDGSPLYAWGALSTYDPEWQWEVRTQLLALRTEGVHVLASYQLQNPSGISYSPDVRYIGASGTQAHFMVADGQPPGWVKTRLVTTLDVDGSAVARPLAQYDTMSPYARELRVSEDQEVYVLYGSGEMGDWTLPLAPVGGVWGIAPLVDGIFRQAERWWVSPTAEYFLRGGETLRSLDRPPVDLSPLYRDAVGDDWEVTSTIFSTRYTLPARQFWTGFRRTTEEP